jgi:hypothetical protein
VRTGPEDDRAVGGDHSSGADGPGRRELWGSGSNGRPEPHSTAMGRAAVELVRAELAYRKQLVRLVRDVAGLMQLPNPGGKQL